MTIKHNRFDQAVKILEEKKVLLEKAYETLYEVTQEKDRVLEHKTLKLAQLRTSLDEGTTTDKIQQMKVYLKTVDEKLAEHKKKVETQQKNVDLAQKQVDVATNELFQRKKDLEKLQMHKQEWEKEVRYWSDRKESSEQDELGSATYQLRKAEEKLRQKKREE